MTSTTPDAPLKRIEEIDGDDVTEFDLQTIGQTLCMNCSKEYIPRELIYFLWTMHYPQHLIWWHRNHCTLKSRLSRKERALLKEQEEETLKKLFYENVKKGREHPVPVQRTSRSSYGKRV